jgi:DNA-binding NarL/FixJ family response regulator
VRPVLAEDLLLLRDGLARLLKAHDFAIATTVKGAPSLQQALLEHWHDVALVDVRLPPTFRA